VLRKSAASKEGARNGCRVGSATWEDLGIIVSTGAIWCTDFVELLVSWRRRADLESQAISIDTKFVDCSLGMRYRRSQQMWLGWPCQGTGRLQ
jgi:hypothetical protein